jgi:anti-sigma regulatory factor (Ser/Thr protein kinase)
LGVHAVGGVEAAAPTAHLDLPPDPTAAGPARRFVAEQVGTPDTDGALSLLTSELVTNAVLHARTALVLGVTRGSSRILVTVADGDRDGNPHTPPPDDERPSGRGLMLVAAMANEWGVFETETGKTVWFTVPRDAAERGRALRHE